MEEQNVKLTAKSGKEYSVPRKTAELSGLIKSNLIDYSIDQAIPLDDINDETLELVIKYLSNYEGTNPQEIEKPIKNTDITEITDKFSSDFINSLSLEELVDITAAANYMEIQSLLDLTCAKFATMVKDKNEEEVFKTFGITTPFTDDEKQKVLEANPWLADNI
jgi:S-phase kinase-associated protein 1